MRQKQKLNKMQADVMAKAMGRPAVLPPSMAATKATPYTPPQGSPYQNSPGPVNTVRSMPGRPMPGVLGGGGGRPMGTNGGTFSAGPRGLGGMVGGPAGGPSPLAGPRGIGGMGAGMAGKMMKKGGKVASASKRADGIAVKGKTRGKII